MMAKKIPLRGKYGEGKFAIVDDDDFAELSKYKWSVGTHGYPQRGIYSNGKTTVLLMHRVIIGAEKGQLVDHINMNKLDNRKANLRIVNKAENMRNCDKRANNTSGYKGVIWSKKLKKWRAEITKDYKCYHIGLFDELEEAARAYDAKAVELFGEYSRLNFPNEPIREIRKPVTRSNNKSGYRGVSWDSRRKKWVAQLSKNGVRVYHEYFDCKHEAALNYNRKAIEFYGDYAKLNEIRSDEVLV